MINTRLPSREF